MKSKYRSAVHLMNYIPVQILRFIRSIFTVLLKYYYSEDNTNTPTEEQIIISSGR